MPNFIWVNREAINRAKEMVFEIVQRGDNPADRRSRGMGGGGPMGPPGMDMGGNASTVEISIPGPKVGLIIGKKLALILIYSIGKSMKFWMNLLERV